MTTAHRPTWKAAVGRAQEGGWSAGGSVSTAKSVLDEPSHTKLKLRGDLTEADQSKEERLRASLAKLQQVEQAAQLKKRIGKRRLNSEEEEQGEMKLLKHAHDIDEQPILAKYDDADDDNDSGGWSDLEDAKKHNDDASDLDADSSDSDDDDGDDSSDESDDEDEEAALQAELAKIRAEREAAKQKEVLAKQKEEEKQLQEAALLGNPLLNVSGTKKNRWNEDVVFRNQAKNEPKRTEKRFINDTVRNDFHKRFLHKFVR